MNWIKVEPNPADNDATPENLPPLEQVVHAVYVDDTGDQAMAFGGRVDSEDGWLWAINDSPQHWRSDDDGYLVADDEYKVTYWAAIQWPERVRL